MGLPLLAADQSTGRCSDSTSVMRPALLVARTCMEKEGVVRSITAGSGTTAERLELTGIHPPTQPTSPARRKQTS